MLRVFNKPCSTGANHYNVFVLAFDTCLDTFKMVPSVAGQAEGTGVSLFHNVEKCTKDACVAHKGCRVAPPDAHVAEPFIRKITVFVNRWVNAVEMKRSRAAIATNQVSAPTA